MAVGEEMPTAAEIGSIRVYLTPIQARARIFPKKEWKMKPADCADFIQKNRLSHPEQYGGVHVL